MAEFKYAQGRIPESLSFISQEINEFEKDYASKTWTQYQKDRKLQKLMDRTIENILTALIEVSGTVLTNKNISTQNYSQVLKETAKSYNFTEEEQEKLSKLALQRNRLAHRYLNFRWQAITMFKELKPLILKLLVKILESEDKNKT